MAGGKVSFRNASEEMTPTAGAEASTARVASSLSDEGFQNIKDKLLADLNQMLEPIHGRIDDLKKENLDQHDLIKSNVLDKVREHVQDLKVKIRENHQDFSSTINSLQKDKFAKYEKQFHNLMK